MQYFVDNGMVYDSDRKVGALYSKAYRYKWNCVKKEHIKTVMFYPPLVLFLVQGGDTKDLIDDHSKLSVKGEELVGELFRVTEKKSFLEDLKYIAIKWVSPHNLVRVTEEGGYEKIECFEEIDWIKLE